MHEDLKIEELLRETNRLRKRVRELEDAELRWKEAEETLLQSERKYRTIFENTGAATILIDPDTTIIMVNTEYEKLTGTSREELEGKRSWTETIHPDDLPEMINYHYLRRNDPALAPRNYEARIVTRKGETRYCYLTVAVIPGTRQSVASFLDVTERKKAEEAILRSEEKFAKAFRSSPDAMAITSLKEGRFIDVNDSFLRFTGRTREETINHTSVEIHLWSSEDYRRGLIEKLLERGRLQNEEVLFHHRSGDPRSGVFSADTIELLGETCMISVFADVTEQKRLEKEILDISERERRQIGQDLHDDLQQHLIGIEAMGKLLTNRLNAHNLKEAEISRDIVELIRTAITKTRTLARGLCPIYLDENTLAPAIREFAANIQSLFDVSCKVVVGKSVSIRDNTTAAHLYQIIQESVNNAIRHGRATAIDIRMASQKNILRLSIADNGSGISEAKGKKKGLGLSIMNHRAKIIGGELEVRKNAKGGTTIVCLVKQK